MADNNCTTNELFNFVQGSDITGQSAYDIWKGLGHTGTEEEFLEFIRTGSKGDQGKSAYEEWASFEVNKGKTYDQFIEFIRGNTGASAYDVWLTISGNEGKTMDDFYASLKGDPGVAGETGPKGETGPQGEKGDPGNEFPIDFITMRDTATSKLYKLVITNGAVTIQLKE